MKFPHPDAYDSETRMLSKHQNHDSDFMMYLDSKFQVKAVQMMSLCGSPVTVFNKVYKVAN